MTLNELIAKHPDKADLPVYIYDGYDSMNLEDAHVYLHVYDEPPEECALSGQTWLCISTDRHSSRFTATIKGDSDGDRN